MDAVCRDCGQPIVFRTRPGGRVYPVHIRDEAVVIAPVPQPEPPAE